MLRAIFVAICGLVFGFLPSIVNAQITARYFQVYSEAAQVGHALAVFRDQLEKISLEKIRLTPVPAASPIRIVEELRAGKVDFAFISTYALGEIDPSFQVFELPFLFDDVAAVSRFFSGKGGDVLKNRLRAKGLEPLAIVDDGMSVGLSRSPISSLGDLRGRKYAVLPSEKLTTSMLAVIDASATPTNAAGVAAMFRNGTVDGFFGPATVFINRSPELANFSLIPTRHSYLGYVLLSGEKFLRDLSPDLQKAVHRAAVVAEGIGKEQALERISRLEATFRKVGVRITPLSDSDLAKWRRSAQSIWVAFDNTVGQQLVDYAKASTGGGGDPCAKLSECRCVDRTCSTVCCKK